MWLLKSELWHFPEAPTRGLDLGTLGGEAMSGADVCWGWQNSLGGLTARRSPGPQKARLAASPLSSWGEPVVTKRREASVTQCRPVGLHHGGASMGEQSINPDSLGLLVPFSTSSSFSPPSLLTAGAVSNQHLRLARQYSVLPTLPSSSDSWFTLIRGLTALHLQYQLGPTPALKLFLWEAEPTLM